MPLNTNKMYSWAVVVTIVYLILIGVLGHFVIRPLLIKYNISIIKNLIFIVTPIMLIGFTITILIDKNILLRDTFSRKFIFTQMTAGVFVLLSLITKHNQNLF